MSATAIGFMTFICLLVWGGFCLLLGRALRRESLKRQRQTPSTPRA